MRISPLASKAALEDSIADKVLTPAELVIKCQDQLAHAEMIKAKADKDASKKAKRDAKKPAASKFGVEEDLDAYYD